MDQERDLLLHHHEGNQNHHDEGGFSWLTATGFLFLTFNSAMAIYRSEGEMSSVAFVVFSYLDLVALFYCLRKFEKMPPDSASRRRLAFAVSAVATAATIFVVSGRPESMDPGNTSFTILVLLVFAAFLVSQALLIRGMIK